MNLRVGILFVAAANLPPSLGANGHTASRNYPHSSLGKLWSSYSYGFYRSSLACRGGASSSAQPLPLLSRTPVPVRADPNKNAPRPHGWSLSRSDTAASVVPPPSRESTTTEQSSASRTDAKDALDAFLTRDSRNSFVARVYAILSVQLIFTAVSVILFGTHPEWSRWMRTSGSPGTLVPFASLLLSTICWFVMCSSANARRQSPLKWQLLALFTLGEAMSVGFISAFYTFRSVVTAMGASAVAATAVSIYTATQKNPKYDLSQWGAGLSSCGLIFVVYGLIQLLSMVGILPTGLLPYHETLYGLFGACLFSFYLAYHTKLIVAGKHSKYQMNEKDYVFGAMTLYNDIINLFIYTLRLIGEDRDDGR